MRSHSCFPVSQGVLVTEFWVLDSTTAAQLKGQTLSNSNRSPSNSATVSPFQVEGFHTPAHLGLSTSADRRGKGDDNLSGATSGPSPIPSTSRGMSDVTLLDPTTSQALLHQQVIYLLWYQFLPHLHMKQFQLIIVLHFHLNKSHYCPHNSSMFIVGVISVKILEIWFCMTLFAITRWAIRVSFCTLSLILIDISYTIPCIKVNPSFFSIHIH